MVNVDGKKITTFGNALHYVFNKIAEIKLAVVAKTTLIFVIIILVILGINISINRSERETILHHIMLSHSNDEKEDLSIRDMVSPKIQKRLKALVYTLHCDRAFVIELHNGKKNATELPFKYFDMTYEEVNENRHVKHISQNFVDVMTTHYKLPFYLAANTYFAGDVCDIEKIDKRFAGNFEDHRGAFLAMMTLRVNGEEIGFLGISYDEQPENINPEKLKDIMTDECNVIKDLLDLGTQKAIIHFEKVEK